MRGDTRVWSKGRKGRGKGRSMGLGQMIQPVRREKMREGRQKRKEIESLRERRKPATSTRNNYRGSRKARGERRQAECCHYSVSSRGSLQRQVLQFHSHYRWVGLWHAWSSAAQVASALMHSSFPPAASAAISVDAETPVFLLMLKMMYCSWWWYFSWWHLWRRRRYCSCYYRYWSFCCWWYWSWHETATQRKEQ